MVYGYFLYGTDVPCVEVTIFSGTKVMTASLILDTGFSGYLKVTKDVASEFGVIPFSDVEMRDAVGRKIYVGLARHYVELGNKRVLADVLISDGPQLAGIGLFTALGYTIVIDCKNRKVHLESSI